MALSISHTFVSTITDSTDASLVRPSNWNAVHTVSGTVASTDVTFTSVSASTTISAPKYTVTSTTTASAVSIINSTSQTAAYTLKLPVDDGTPGQVLATDGSGVLSWSSVSTSSSAGTSGSTFIGVRLFPAGNEAPTTNFATLDTRSVHPVLDFDDTTAEAAVWTCVMDPSYSGAATGLTFQVAHTITSSSTGTVGWTVELERIGTSLDIDSDNFGTPLTITAAGSTNAGGVVTVLSAATTSTAVISGILAGEMYRIRVKRDVASDNCAGDAELHWASVRQS